MYAPPVDFNEMYLFIQVVKAGSFSAAGRSLGIPKTTISRKVAHLEATLGSRLLHRTTRHQSLTDIGQLYYDRCTNILADLEEANRMVTVRQEVPVGTLRLTAPSSFGTAILNQWMDDFLTHHKQVKLDVVLTNQYLDLLAEGIDIAFRGGPLADSSLNHRKVCDLPYWVCASPTYLDVYGIPKDPADLNHHRCISFSTGRSPSGAPWRFRDHLGWVEINMDAQMIVNDVSFAHQAILSGGGISYFPGTMVRDDIQNGRLVRLLSAWPLTTREVYLVYRGDRLLSPKVRAFLEFVEEKIPDLLTWLASTK